MAERVVILGASGHGKVVADCFRAAGMPVVGFLDHDKPAGSTWADLPVLGGDDELESIHQEQSGTGFFVAIGDNNVRREVTQRVLNTYPGLELVTCIHPSAVISSEVLLEEGCAVFARAVIQPGCALGKGCLVNTGAILDHDGRMGDFSSLAPGVVAGGNVAVGLCSAVSLGAHLKHGIRVGAHSVVGMAAVVTRDIPDEVVAYGNPARVIRKRQRGERYL